MSPLQNLLKDRFTLIEQSSIYTLIEQSGIYSNRAVRYTLIEHAYKYPFPYEVFQTFQH